MTSQDGLYIQMFSVHGLLRAENMELGYDADTGGQIKYLVELCSSLSANPNIKKIDLFTRLIQDKSYSEDYSVAEDRINDKFRIIRIQCGGRKYIRKELLWPYLDEFVDKTIKFIQTGREIPDLIHGHYPDAGYVAKELARFFGVPFVYTGHSLGRPKKARLLSQGADPGEMDKDLKIEHRIAVEENILKYADMVITSTQQEIEGQYGMYRNRTLPRYKVIPPGIDIDRFYPYYRDHTDTDEKEIALFAKESLTSELNRFFQHPDKPMILVLCRPDKRKNIEGLIKAYGEDYDLQAIANLAVFAGIRKDIAQKGDSERDVLTRMLLLMDKYNLYGKMAIPKRHDFEHEVPELYRIAAEKKGVFVNPSLTEPFGLTLLEALACGLPIVATNNGGPPDIIRNCKSGTLVDPRDTTAIASAIKEIIVHEDKWRKFSKNGIMNIRKTYTWSSHVQTYADEMKNLCRAHQTLDIQIRVPRHSIGKRLAGLNYLLITDIDNTLLGGDPKELAGLMEIIEKNSHCIGFGVATGRLFESARDILSSHGITPDIIISSVGSQIHYGKDFYLDKGWETHISKNWKPGLIRERLKEIDFITFQEQEVQTPHKLSCFMKPGKDRLERVHHVLTKNRFQYTLIYSHDRYLDILPYRASKGKAVRYLSYKWQIPLGNFMVCGDSGNDAEMLKGEPRGVVVGNYSPELEELKTRRRIYFAKKTYAGGMMEGMDHYGFIRKAKGSLINDT
ncbi:HAD-IIB family hydrolase [Desulfospira joergensenii]|uniref:HAD-IIB family hydrolase n=1 Tax=Desulfospira joergensenii TaxID=53329 RepID=UPI0003B76F04|nr:HAD-IIB family hydrolase [Desulfospira joergensenii]